MDERFFAGGSYFRNILVDERRKKWHSFKQKEKNI